MKNSSNVKIIHVVGARPNFIKILPIMTEMQKYPNVFNQLLVHTNQHYDYAMSEQIFENIRLKKPNINLRVRPGTHAVQTANIMIEFEKVCFREKPDLILVVGDVNSTLACSLVAAKLQIPIAHLEAGLRSFDRSMPEEINRIVTDSLSDLLFTPFKEASENLKKEGIPTEKIYLVGDIIVDMLLKFVDKSNKNIMLNIKEIDYALLTLHRPSNVDNRDTFIKIIETLLKLAKKIPIVFPVHPRTRKQIKYFGYGKYFIDLQLKEINKIRLAKSINLVNALPYVEFINLMKNAKFVITDSGGIQTETTFLKIPCLTLRNNTEKSITVKKGTNILVGTDSRKILSESLKILSGKSKQKKIPALWDGKTAERVVEIIKKNFRPI